MNRFSVEETGIRNEIEIVTETETNAEDEETVMKKTINNDPVGGF